jgi:hypothetical protein
MKTKSQFLSDPKRSRLSQKEQEKRWKQYQASQVNTRANAARGRTRGTKLKVNQDGQLQIHLSHCARSYLQALMFGFSHKEVACIPDLHSVPSQKVRVKTRGTFSTGTTGFGWIVVSPHCTVNDGATLGFTDSTYGLPFGSPILNPGVVVPGVGQGFAAQLPWNSVNFEALTTNGVQSRTVGSALRIRYIGSEMSRSGQIIGIRHLDNETLVALTASDLRAQSTAKTYQNSREWTYVAYRPVKPAEYEFSPFGCADADGPITAFKWPMGFFIEGTTNTTGSVGAAPFEYEYVQFVEYIGHIGNITKSHVDIVGMSDIRNSLPEKSTFDNERVAKLKLARDLVTTIADRSGARSAEIAPALSRLMNAQSAGLKN